MFALIAASEISSFINVILDLYILLTITILNETLMNTQKLIINLSKKRFDLPAKNTKQKLKALAVLSIVSGSGVSRVDNTISLTVTSFI